MKRLVLILTAALIATNVSAQSETTQTTPATRLSINTSADPGSISVYPNPFNKFDNALNVSFFLKDDATVSVRLFDSFDNLIKNFDVLDVQAGFHNFHYETGNLKEGVYFMDITINGVSNVKRIMCM